MSFACFRVCYLRKIQLQSIQNCLPEYFSQIVIACGFNNRKSAERYPVVKRQKQYVKRLQSDENRFQHGSLTFALTCDGAFLLRARRRQMQRVVDGKRDVRNGSDDLGHAAMRLKPNPLNPVGTGLKTGDVNPEVRDMMLLSTRLRVWNPDVVVPPSELRCHGRRFMVQSLSASHASLHRSHSPITTMWSVESVEHANMPTISTDIHRISQQV